MSYSGALAKLPLHVDVDVTTVLTWLDVVSAVVDIVSNPILVVAGHTNEGLNGGTWGGNIARSKICKIACALGRSEGVG